MQANEESCYCVTSSLARSIHTELQEGNQATLTGKILFYQQPRIKQQETITFGLSVLSFVSRSSSKDRTKLWPSCFLFAKNEVHKIQNKRTRLILMRGRKKKTNPRSFRVLCYLHRDAGCFHLFLFFFCPPPAFQDNNLNAKPELHFFALLKHCGNL